MNKPAPKEPSMDEILSSIRQIIADDDAGTRRPEPPPAANQGAPAAAVEPEPHDDSEAPLALSAEEMIDPPPGHGAASVAPAAERDEPAAPPPEAEAAADPFAGAELIEGDDVTFESERQADAHATSGEPSSAYSPRNASFQIPVATAAPMPDPTLSRDIAEQLLEPATKAAVKHTFARLGSVALASPGMTLEDMVRDMLRPMLKEWLDENLPAVVERMVEREIERISRGGQ